MKNTFDTTVQKNLLNQVWMSAITIMAVAVNVLLSFLMFKLGFPFMLDTVGTILISGLSGMLFSGIITAVVSSFFCSFFYESALYLGFVNAIIAIVTVWFTRKYSFKKIGKAIIFAFIISFASGLSVSLLQALSISQIKDSLTVQNATSLSSITGLPYCFALFIINFVMQLMDKGLSCILAITFSFLIPSGSFTSFTNRVWKQRPLSENEIQTIKSWRHDLKHSMRARTTLIIVVTGLLIVVVMGSTSYRLYYNAEKAKKTEKAVSLSKAAASMIDAGQIDGFLKYGREAPGYVETEELLTKIWQASPEVAYLYVIKIEENGARFIFDIDNPEQSPILPYYPGEIVPFDPEFEPYMNDLFAGKELPPVESNDMWGWLLTVYYPVRNVEGNTVCYVGTDISLEYLAGNIGAFVLKVFMTMAGFFVLIIAYALWKIGVYTSFPISSISACVERFALSGEDQEKLDENVRIIRSLDIKTGDEVEKLYQAICKMTVNQANQMRAIRNLSDSTAKMQDGLIITMADMVESRDSDTGAHVQKTAAYVKIIVEGLKKKGYYAQKITPKFMSDVVRSAPLHDVGKINIPDGVLNKPGKLTDEEFAIMKTHTTAGKKILENAISTVQGENYLKEARNMAAYHHERWDGKGYPEGLHGEVIPLSARIMAVADVFDALASPRVYKPAFPLEKALAILQEGAGTQFDAKCVEVFMDALPEVKMILMKYSSPV